MSVKLTFDIAATMEGNMGTLVTTKPVHVPYTLEQVLAAMAALAFTVETIAHLGGKERELLPQAEKARTIIAALQPRTLP